MARGLGGPCGIGLLVGFMLAASSVARGGIIATGDVAPDPSNPLLSFSRRIYVGEENSGALTIDGGSELKSDGGSLGRFVNSSGQVTISGQNTIWDATFLTSPTFHVGVRGRGELHLQQGGQLVTGHARVASEVEGFGTVFVDGVNSVWRNDGIRVGDKSEGHLAISGGGQVVSNGNNRIGAESSANGTVTVTGSGSAWTQSEYVVMGSGSLHIEDGAMVSNTWSNVAALSASQAHVTVSGAGSQWLMSDALRLASGFRIANDAPGSAADMKIEAGGSVRTAKSASIGVSEGSTADVLIDGIGSNWQHDGEMLVGDSGHGTMRIVQGGSLTVTSAHVGFTATGTGQATVSGPESNWRATRELSVGMAGSGTMDVQMGATVTSETGVIGTLGRGTVTIAGNRSRWSVDEELYIGGFGGDGTLAVSEEGLVEVGGDLTLGHEADSVAEVTVSSDAVMEIEGVTTVGRGENSMATLTIAEGGLFDADDDIIFALSQGSRAALYLEPGGELNLHGHKIRVGDGTPEFHIFGGTLRNVGVFGTHLNHVGGMLAAGSSPGTMQIQGDYDQADGAVLEVELSIPSTTLAAPGHDFDYYQIDGDAKLNGTLHIGLLTGYQPQAGDSFEVLQARTIIAAELTLTGADGFESQILLGPNGTERLLLTYVPEPCGNGLRIILSYVLFYSCRRVSCRG